MKKKLILAGAAIGGLAWVAMPAQAAGYQTVTFTSSAAFWQTPPECGENNPGCAWRLTINEPNVGPQPVESMVSPYPGQLSVPLPPYCGLIQADGFVSNPDGTWRRLTEGGTRTTINLCEPNTTTSTLEPPPSPTTTVPPTTTTTTVPPTVTTTTVAPEVPVVAPTPSVPNQLPDIAPATNGVTQGNG